MKDTKVSGNVYPSKVQLNATRNGIYSQLKTSKIAEIYGSLANGIEELGLDDFIENQIKVLASAYAWVHHTEMRLQKELHKEESVTVETPSLSMKLHKDMTNEEYIASNLQWMWEHARNTNCEHAMAVYDLEYYCLVHKQKTKGDYNGL